MSATEVGIRCVVCGFDFSERLSALMGEPMSKHAFSTRLSHLSVTMHDTSHERALVGCIHEVTKISIV